MSTRMQFSGGLELLVAECVAVPFPDQNDIGSILPQVDFSRGHVASDVCQVLARERKQSPQEIARTLLPLLEQACNSRVTFAEGFLNFQFRENDWQLLSGAGDPALLQQRIFLTSFVESLSPAEYVRLAALASAQALHAVRLNGGVEIVCSSMPAVSVRTRGDVYSFLLATIEMCMSKSSTALSPDQAAEELIAFLESEQSAATIWLAPRTLTRKRYTDIFKKFADPKIEFRCPPRALLYGGSTDEIPALLPDLVVPLLWYLASDTLGVDLDLFTPSAKENSNCIWFAQALQSRAERLGLNSGDQNLFAIPASLSELTDIQQSSLIRACLLERFCWSAASRGLITDWYSGFSALLESANTLLNNPGERISLESGTISPVERKIITGVLNSVSDMIPLWRE